MKIRKYSIFVRLAALVLIAALQLDVLHYVGSEAIPTAAREISAAGYDTPGEGGDANDANVCLRQALRTRAALCPAPSMPLPAAPAVRAVSGPQQAATAFHCAARPEYSVYCVYRI